MPKRYDNTICKLFLRSKKTIKATLNSITRIGPIIYIEDLEECYGPYKQDSTSTKKRLVLGQDQYAGCRTDKTSRAMG